MVDTGIRSPIHAPLHPDRMEHGPPDLDQTSDVASGNHQIQVPRITRVAQGAARDTKGVAWAPHSSVADTTGATAQQVASEERTRAMVP